MSKSHEIEPKRGNRKPNRQSKQHGTRDFISKSIRGVGLTTKSDLGGRLDVREDQADQVGVEAIHSWDVFEERLEDTKRSYKRAEFDENVKALTAQLFEFLRGQSTRETPAYWKARTLIYELNEILHVDEGIVDWTFNEGARVLKRLQIMSNQVSAIEIKKRQLVREQVLFSACYGYELRRRNKAREALGVLEWLLKFTQERVKRTEMPCWGTRANLLYHIGSTHRLLEEYDPSEGAYTQSIEAYYERANRRLPEDVDDLLFTIRRIAMCVGLGFGWLNLTRGELRRAENALATARAMLARSDDPIVPAYIKLLYGTIKRCRAGKDEASLRKAILSLGEARTAFQQHSHHRYEARASWELALAFNLTGDYDKADGCVDTMWQYAVKQQDCKWQANVHVLRSRLLRNRGKYREALKAAEAANDKARQCGSILPRIDALIARGEAHLYLSEYLDDEQYAAARLEFERTLKMLRIPDTGGGDTIVYLNPKIASVCVLRTAQCYAREGDKQRAIARFEEWRSLRPHVEHGWVRSLGNEVANEIQHMPDGFWIPSNDPKKLNYTFQLTKLQKWLAEQALNHTNDNSTAAAGLIGVSRATVHEWRYPDAKRKGSRRRGRGSSPKVKD